MSKDIFLIKSALAKNKDSIVVNLYNVDTITLEDCGTSIKFWNGPESSTLSYDCKEHSKKEFDVLLKAATSLDMFNNI